MADVNTDMDMVNHHTLMDNRHCLVPIPGHLHAHIEYQPNIQTVHVYTTSRTLFRLLGRVGAH